MKNTKNPRGGDLLFPRRYFALCLQFTCLNYVSPLLNNIGYSMAVEKLYGIEAPRRAEFTRVIMGESSRITDHLTCVGAAAMEVGAFTFFLWFIKAREYLWEVVEEVTGARMTTNWTRFGGNATDIPDGFFDALQERLFPEEFFPGELA